jgi:hypothetical protein
MNRPTIALTLGLLFGLALAPVALAQSAPQAPVLSEQDAHAIGVDAYLYLYPLVTMDLTRKQFTNIEPGKEVGKGPMNMFANIAEYPPANFKGVVRPNFDTLYCRVDPAVTRQAPHRPGRAQLTHPVPRKSECRHDSDAEHRLPCRTHQMLCTIRGRGSASTARR